MPCFDRFAKHLQNSTEYIATSKEYDQGELAKYIPSLKNANPDSFATSFCSSSG